MIQLKTSPKDARIVYENHKGKDFVLVKLEHGKRYYEGELLNGEVEFFSTSNQTPCIIVDFYKTIKFQESSISKKIKFLSKEERKIELTSKSNKFSIQIPFGCGGNESVIIESEETIVIEFVYELRIFMKKNSLINFFGSIPIDNFESKVNLKIFSLPLLDKLNNQVSFVVADESPDWRPHQFSVTFPAKVFFLSQEVDLVINYRKQEKGKSIKSVFVYLYQKIAMKLNTIEDSREEILEGILEPILIGSISIDENDKETIVVKVKIPSNILTDQYSQRSDFFIENFFEISASLMKDRDASGPSIDQDVHISSPIISRERLNKIK